MEEKIKEIMQKMVLNFCDENGESTEVMMAEEFPEVAKEIADHFREFITWLDFGDHDFYLNAEKGQTDYYKEGDYTLYTLDELYTYWQTKVRQRAGIEKLMSEDEKDGLYKND